jgi:hypothetical protein
MEWRFIAFPLGTYCLCIVCGATGILCCQLGVEWLDKVGTSTCLSCYPVILLMLCCYSKHTLPMHLDAVSLCFQCMLGDVIN